jgi:hypothetical protein
MKKPSGPNKKNGGDELFSLRSFLRLVFVSRITFSVFKDHSL